MISMMRMDKSTDQQRVKLLNYGCIFRVGLVFKALAVLCM